MGDAPEPFRVGDDVTILLGEEPYVIVKVQDVYDGYVLVTWTEPNTTIVRVDRYLSDGSSTHPTAHHWDRIAHTTYQHRYDLWRAETIRRLGTRSTWSLATEDQIVACAEVLGMAPPVHNVKP